ncbi:low-density lipoprotein receptor-related protein 6-like [Pomacea canaliculata]|uniref:low-density lipoprotein receptor-related protein 6-like n=1 Tax=Pomacea canaliculata TaxID=400727 RepID=UPI000D739209|nr:low-density lipoprotein receptor-related protein 6-like [Pomacea canaliculata]
MHERMGYIHGCVNGCKNGCEYEGRKLYWADIGTHLIGWTDLDGTYSGVYFKLEGSYFMGLDIYQNELFVTDWGPKQHMAETTRISRIGKNGTLRTTVQVNYFVNDVRVYAEERTHKASTSAAPTSNHTIRGQSSDSNGAETLNIILVGVIVALVVAVVIAILVVFIIKKKCK